MEYLKTCLSHLPINHSGENIQSLAFSNSQNSSSAKNENDDREGMRCTVMSKEKSSTVMLTHFTCNEGTYLVIFILRNLFEKYGQFANSVCVFQHLYRVQYYGFLLSEVLWNSKQMVNYVKITDSFDFPVVKK